MISPQATTIHAAVSHATPVVLPQRQKWEQLPGTLSLHAPTATPPGHRHSPTGNHTKHYTDAGYSCAECHGTGADAGTQSGHDNGTRDISFTNVTGSINATKACSVYCHNPNPTYDPKPNPTWNVTNVSCVIVTPFLQKSSQPGVEKTIPRSPRDNATGATATGQSQEPRQVTSMVQ